MLTKVQNLYQEENFSQYFILLHNYFGETQQLLIPFKEKNKEKKIQKTQNEVYMCLFYSIYMQCNQEAIVLYVKESEYV